MNSSTVRRAGWFCLAPLISPAYVSPAMAHSFAAGADNYTRFVEGAGVILGWPVALLAIAALGLMASLWKVEGLLTIWPAFIVGLIAGVFAAPLAGPWIVPIIAGFGAVTASLAALLQRQSRKLLIMASGMTGLLVMAYSLEGHGLLELSFFIHLGIFFGANLALAMCAALARLTLEHGSESWSRIAVRVAASWIGAALVISLAFAIR